MGEKKGTKGDVWGGGICVAQARDEWCWIWMGSVSACAASGNGTEARGNAAAQSRVKVGISETSNRDREGEGLVAEGFDRGGMLELGRGVWKGRAWGKKGEVESGIGLGEDNVDQVGPGGLLMTKFVIIGRPREACGGPGGIMQPESVGGVGESNNGRGRGRD